MEDPPIANVRLVNKRQICLEKRNQLSSWNTPRNTPSGSLRLQESTSSPQQDRISTLPQRALYRILSMMPMESAVRTSILSKAWRNLWKHTQVIDFHRLPISDNKADYVSITRTLYLIESPEILSFTVVGHVSDCSLPEVKKWFDFAFSKNVRHLRIGLMSISSMMTYFLLPYSLLTSSDHTQNLEILFLSRVDFKPYRGAFSGSGFANLTYLGFAKSKLDDRTVRLFILKCLLLEDLALDMCTGLENVNISGSHLKLKRLTFRWPEHTDGKFRLLRVEAPSLVTLFYSGDLTQILLNNCQGLEFVVLQGKKEPIEEAYTDDIRELIIQITQVKILGVNFQFLEFEARKYYTRGCPFLKFENLERLLWFDSPKCPNDVYDLVAFLGDCPSLEDCVVDFREECWSAFCQFINENYVEDECNVLEGARDNLYDGRYLEKLKSITVVCFSGFANEMMLVRLLLEKAVNLQKLEIYWRQSDLSLMTDNVIQIIFTSGYPQELVAQIQEDSDSIKETIAAFPKASPNAQILYKTKWEVDTWCVLDS